MAEQIGITMYTGTLIGAKQILDEGKYDATCEFYHDPDFVHGIERESFDRRRALEMGRNSRLMEEMCKQKATPKEFRRLVLYSYICIDSLKKGLNFKRAMEDLEIETLRSKYLTRNN